MRLLIVGATPLGAYLAATFHLLQQAVRWLADAPTVEALTRAGGITLISERERRFAARVPVTASLDEAFSANYDAVFFVMRGYDTALTLYEMRRRLKTPPPIITLQAGIGNAERIESVYGAANVIRGALSVVIETPYHGDQPLLSTVVRMETGGVGLAENHARSREIAALLWAASLPVTLGSGRDLQWSALFWQLQTNAIPALIDVPAEEVYHSPALFGIEYRQSIEALGILEALKIRLIDLPGAPVNKLATQFQTLPIGALTDKIVRNTAPSSLRAELARGSRASEAAYLNGAIALHARDLKRQAPINHALALIVQDIAEKRAAWSQFQRNPPMLEALIGIAARH